jgi:AcrR family transcriptional regulator
MGIKERKELEKQEMRKLILDTAMKLFLEKGIENITLRHIAEKIEYSPATIYLYFKDKDELIYTLHREGFEKLYGWQQKILSIKDPLKRLHKHAQMYVSFALENPEYYDLMFIERAPFRTIKEFKCKDDMNWEIGMRSYELLRMNIKDCIEAGVFQNTDIEVAAFSMWAYVHGIVSLIIRERCKMFPEEHLDNLVKGALDFMQDNILLIDLKNNKRSYKKEEM